MGCTWNLRVTDRRGRARTVTLTAFPAAIGRDETLPVGIDDPQASRKHAQIEKNDETSLRIADLNSTNGTFLNGRKISRSNVNHGDRVKIGETIIEFCRIEDVAIEEDTGKKGLSVLKSFSTPKKPSALDQLDEKAIVLSRIGDPSPGSSGAVNIQRLTLLADVARILTEPHDRDEMFSMILEGLMKVFPIDRAAILLKRAETGTLDASVSKSKEGVTTGLVVSRTICQHVYASGESIITEDAMSDSRFSSGDSIIEHRVGAVIGAPIAARMQTLGVLYASTTERAAKFTDLDLSFVALVCNLMGLVVLLDQPKPT